MFSPAKINLFLATNGRRPDGFHELLSVAAPLDFGDELSAEAADGVSLLCDREDMAVDESNLVLKAAGIFARETGWKGGARFFLKKKIPMGAGLGGGSSNGAVALRLLNELSGGLASGEKMNAMAAELGSDCVMFLQDRPVIMRGRGDLVEQLPEDMQRRLKGRRILLFKPEVAVPTAWAYGKMIRDNEAGKAVYLSKEEAGLRLEKWISGEVPLEDFIFNNMEPSVFPKYVVLPVLLAELKKRFGFACRMSGSGSACFALPGEETDSDTMEKAKGLIREFFGINCFLEETRLL